MGKGIIENKSTVEKTKVKSDEKCRISSQLLGVSCRPNDFS